MKYYAEEPCEHGFLRSHFLASDWGNTETACPGGSRRELTDVEVVETRAHFTKDGEWDWECVEAFGCPSNRYLIIPLPPEADE